MHRVYISTLILTWFCLHTLELCRTLQVLTPIPEFLSSTKRSLTNKPQLGLIKKKTHLLTELGLGSDCCKLNVSTSTLESDFDTAVSSSVGHNLLHLEADAGPTGHVAASVVMHLSLHHCLP